MDAAARWLRQGVESADQPPKYFSPGFVRLANAAAVIALRRGDAKLALQYADNALAHLHSKAARASFPYLEAEPLKTQRDATMALSRSTDPRPPG
jgi:hypothetical protein